MQFKKKQAEWGNKAATILVSNEEPSWDLETKGRKVFNILTESEGHKLPLKRVKGEKNFSSVGTAGTSSLMPNPSLLEEQEVEIGIRSREG